MRSRRSDAQAATRSRAGCRAASSLGRCGTSARVARPGGLERQLRSTSLHASTRKISGSPAADIPRTALHKPRSPCRHTSRSSTASTRDPTAAETVARAHITSAIQRTPRSTRAELQATRYEPSSNWYWARSRTRRSARRPLGVFAHATVQSAPASPRRPAACGSSSLGHPLANGQCWFR